MTYGGTPLPGRQHPRCQRTQRRVIQRGARAVARRHVGRSRTMCGDRVAERSDQGAVVHHLASPGMCSVIDTPGAAVAIGRNSPRIASGASGLRSHMSIVAGPPESQIWITPVAGPAVLAVSPAASARVCREASDPAARRRRRSRNRGDETPRSRSVFREHGGQALSRFQWLSTNSRVLMSAQSTSARGRGSIGPRANWSRAARISSSSGSRDRVARNSSSTASAAQRPDAATGSFTRPDLILSSNAASVIRKSVCGSAGLPGRSQSQIATRSGRPKTRKTRARSGDVDPVGRDLDRPRPLRHIGAEVAGHAERRVERIDENFGHHGPGLGAGEVAVVVEVPPRRARTTADRRARSKPFVRGGGCRSRAATKSAARRVEQSGVGGRVGDREAVDRVNQPSSEVSGPDAVDEAAGEVRVVRLRQPREEPPARGSPEAGSSGPPSARARAGGRSRGRPAAARGDRRGRSRSAGESAAASRWDRPFAAGRAVRAVAARPSGERPNCTLANMLAKAR